MLVASLFSVRFVIYLTAVSVFSGCSACQRSATGQPSAIAASPDNRGEASRSVPPTFQSFYDSLKKSYEVEELREAANRFAISHANHDGSVPREQWPEIFRVRKEGVNEPTHVYASVGARGLWTMTIEY